MALTRLVDVEALLAPIPGDAPSGSPVSFDRRQQFEDFRKEDPEADKKPDWPAVVELAKETLTATSKDLLVAARLTEALVKLHGFTGLRDGLHLLRALIDRCWDRLIPPIEDGDIEVRAGPFHWLDSPDRGARFPSTLRLLPLILGKDVQYSWLDWKYSQEPGRGIDPAEIQKTALAMEPERCAALAAEIQQSLEEVDQLTQSLATKLGPIAPSLLSVREAVKDCDRLIHEIQQKLRPVSPAEEDKPSSEPVGKSAPRTAPSSRAEAYRQLAQVAATLRAIEPHSPIPYLIERAVELGSMPFPLLLRALIRDANVLGELSREFGLKDMPPPEPPPAG